MKNSDNITIIDIFEDHVSTKPNSCAYGFLKYKGSERSYEELTYFELYKQVTDLSHRLLETNEPGDRILLAFAPDQMREFIIAFYACLYVGLIAVPVYPPRMNKPLSRFNSIVNSCSANTIICTRSLIMKNKDYIESELKKTFHWLTTDASYKGNQTIQRPVLKAGSLAFLQYTSGSTGDPKGVMVNHGNIIANQKMIRKAFSHDEKSRFVGWLPLFHDMGLIGNVLQPMFLGVESILLPPASFLQEPLRWLIAISDFHAHTSGGPNFAYDLCVDAYRQNKGNIKLDLSSWKVAFNGSEPIRADTIKNFSSCFTSVGLDPNTMYPCYGLAEATLFVTGSEKLGSPILLPVDFLALQTNSVIINPQSNYLLVSSGLVTRDDNVVIVDQNKFELCEDSIIGEIWICGENVTNGYWQCPEINRTSFSQIQNIAKNYFRTGDLGFIHDKQLYVTGRIKDLIIVRGKNYYPQDIENIAKIAHHNIKQDIAAAFAIQDKDDQVEKLIVIVELKRTAKNVNINEIENTVISAINRELQIKPAQVLCVRMHTIPITSSGKVQRNATRTLYLNNKLEPFKGKIEVYETSLKNVKSIVQGLMSDKLQSNNIDLSKSLEDYGYDSFDYAVFLNKLSKRLNITLELSDLIECDNLGEMINYIESKEQKMQASLEKIFHNNLDNTNIQPLSILQKSMFFLQKRHPRSSHYLIERVFSITNTNSNFRLDKICEQLIEFYPILRSELINGSNLCLQVVSDLSKLIKIVEYENEDKFQQQCTLLSDKIKCKENNPLFQILIARIDEFTSKVYWGVNHILVDLWSMSLIAQKFSDLVLNKKPNHEMVPYQNYLAYEKEATENDEHVQFWNQYLNNNLRDYQLLDFPIANSEVNNNDQIASLVNFKFSKKETEIFCRFVDENKLSIFSIFISAYAFLIYKYTGCNNIIIGSPFNNRVNSNFSETVGLFVNTLPLCFSIDSTKSVYSFLQENSNMIASCRKHQQLPLANIIQSSDRFKNQPDVIQVLFTSQRTHISDHRSCMHSAVLNTEKFKTKIADLDLTFEQTQQTCDVMLDMAIVINDEINGYLKYPQNKFSDTFMNQFVDHFLRLLRVFVEEPNNKLDNINILTEHETKELLFEYNQDGVLCEYNNLIELFNLAVKENSNHLAVSDSHSSLTYGELNAKIDALGKIL